MNQATNTTSNLTNIAACMDALVSQMVDAADTLRNSAMTSVAGNSIAKTVSGMEDRAEQIRTITASFRVSGDLANFDQACKLAGWHPTREALESLQVAH